MAGCFVVLRVVESHRGLSWALPHLVQPLSCFDMDAMVLSRAFQTSIHKLLAFENSLPCMLEDARAVEVPIITCFLHSSQESCFPS